LNHVWVVCTRTLVAVIRGSFHSTTSDYSRNGVYISIRRRLNSFKRYRLTFSKFRRREKMKFIWFHVVSHIILYSCVHYHLVYFWRIWSFFLSMAWNHRNRYIKRLLNRKKNIRYGRKINSPIYVLQLIWVF